MSFALGKKVCARSERKLLTGPSTVSRHPNTGRHFVVHEWITGAVQKLKESPDLGNELDVLEPKITEETLEPNKKEEMALKYK